MSEEVISPEATVAEALNEVLFSEPPPLEITEDDKQERSERRSKHYHKANLTPAQLLYQQQVYNPRRQGLVDKMANLVAYTWIPGKDRTKCPPIVDLRDPRLLVMDRYALEPDKPATHIGLTMYRTSVSRSGLVVYGGAHNCEMFKDFAFRPHYKAKELILDSRNDEVFKAALALDQAMELVANDETEPVSVFDPPPCLFGFPVHFQPMPEWRQPMQDEVIKMLHPDSSPLRLFLSPGGLVADITEQADGFVMVSFINNGLPIVRRVPSWTQLFVKVGDTVEENQVYGDVPRGVYSNIREVTVKYPFRTLEWFERHILEERTELLSIDETVFDKQLHQRVPRTTTWRCVPAKFVQNQSGRAVRFFLDFRNHLGRLTKTINNFEEDVWIEHAHQVRVDVLRFEEHPRASDLHLSDLLSTWTADLVSIPEDAPWSGNVPLREDAA